MRLWIILLTLTSFAGCVEDTEPVDSDGDGISDADEIAAGSDPRNATSKPNVIATPIATTEKWPQWGALSGAQIQPGASLGGYCTFNFLFEGPNNTGYIGTAAHCTDGVGERLTLPGVGAIATVVYDSDDVGSPVDFTLARLDGEMIAKANPKMLGWDGPTGDISIDDLSIGDEIQLHGYGVVLGQNDATRDRFGALVDWNEDEYNVDMPAVNGDSGSPLMHGPTGKAFGIISRYGIDNTPPSTDQGPLMPYIYRELAAAGWGDVRLAVVA